MVASAAVAIMVAAGIMVEAQPAAAAVVTPGISLGDDAVVGEGDGHVDVQVKLSAPSSAAVSVVYGFANFTAVNGVDYTCTTSSCFGTLVFAPGQTSQTLRVGILNDAVAEPLESFNIQLSSPTGGSVTRGVVHVSIVDNDAAVGTPKLFVRDAVVDESAGTVSVPVLLGGPLGAATANTVTVHYTTTGGTAVPARISPRPPVTCRLRRGRR